MALKGIVIDPGHGGSDPGAVGNNIKEKDYNLLISKYMYDRFKELGVPVSITRTNDATLSPSDRTKKVKSFYGDSKDVIVISNHLNAGGGEGAEVIYALRNNSTLAKNILSALEGEGLNARKYYQQRLPSNSNKDYYFMLRDTANNQSLIVEYGFIDNVNDVNKIKNNYKKYAEAVVKAICEYKGIKYVPVGDNIYIVKSGDTLWGIARKYNTTVSKLKEINNLSTNNLKIGQVLELPMEEKIENSDNYIEYTVKSGDTLYAIANKYNTTVNEIKQLNNLSTTLLQINQKLKIPNNSIKYIVKKGDTLWDIANKYNTSVSNIKKVNNLSSDLLQIGQVLTISK